MSLASSIVGAINTARKSLGDLIRVAQITVSTNRTYSGGKFTSVDEVKSVEVTPDKFSFEDQNSQDFNQTDIKLIMFNPDNLEVTPQMSMTYEGTKYSIRKAEPTWVGNQRPVYSLTLRK